MEVHKEFVTAGQKPGLQVWRVEKMELAPVPHELYGQFFNGDAYILLYTSKGFTYNVHMWIGEKASQDETGAAAIFMTQMDDHLRGAPVQFRECQNHESDVFMGYFRKGIQYKEGGVASGFNLVVTNDASAKRVLRVKGRRRIRACEVPVSWDSFNKGDCFIIDLGKDIFSWCGSESHFFERLKCNELSKDIRDNERHGRAEVEIIDEDSEPEVVLEILGPKPELCSGSEDVAADQTNRHKASLYLISNADCSMKTTKVADSSPFKQEMLSDCECYILDNGKDDHIFVWKGRGSNKEERKSAFKLAQRFICEKGYSQTTQVQLIPAGSESTLFKQFFVDWLDKDETTGPSEAYTFGNIAKVEKIAFDASNLHSDKTMAAQHGMVDDGSGKVQIWRVEGDDKQPVDCSSHGQFYGGDCYLILYTYNDGGRERHIIYTWQGLKCSHNELGASAILTVALDDSMGGVATQIRVTQGKEPSHLVSMFKDKPLIINRGGTCREHGEQEAGSTRLFHIRQSSTKATRAVEVEPTASSLNSNDMFVLKTPEALYLWKGKGAHQEEMSAANYVAEQLGGSPTEVDEDDEPGCFWEALGGKADYQTSITLQNVVRPPRLFACSNKTGNLIAEEVCGEFTQLDLAFDDVMILDTWDQIFVWIGKDANETEKKGSYKIAADYLNSDPSGRVDVPIITMKQDQECPIFTGWFHAWDADLWNKVYKECMHHEHE